MLLSFFNRIYPVNIRRKDVTFFPSVDPVTYHPINICDLQSFLCIPDIIYQFQIRRKPFHGVKFVLCKPSCQLSLFQYKFPAFYFSEKAIHRQVKFRIIILYGFYQFMNRNLRCQFFPDLANKCFLRCFSSLDLTSRKLPCSHGMPG